MIIQNQNFKKTHYFIQSRQTRIKLKNSKNQNKVKAMWVTHKKRAGVWGILRGIRGCLAINPLIPPQERS
ncbi:hypothetical protein BBW65_03880 [Helicobacter enhydrae]|uniref:Uncharacterized protein n=1 Tax=Helicobacter enhydrae TaxID=222136 RepID=A0A1B1U5F7_9HELI|nr:hypothetical protein BBW65_03880 [Helicobacter enhydrae]